LQFQLDIKINNLRYFGCGIVVAFRLVVFA